MARRVALLCALAAAAIVLLSARTAAACTCLQSGPVCQSYWETPMVFDAVARSVDPESHRVVLDVRRVWKGTVSSTVVTFSADGLSCNYPFSQGKRYLVFASPSGFGKVLSVSSCSATQEWDGTGPSAEFLRSLSRPAAGGRIFGTVRHVTSDGGGVAPREVPVETAVHLHTPAGTKTVTSKNGEYAFTGLARGRYRISVEAPAGYVAIPSWPHPSNQAIVSNSRACAWLPLTLTDHGRIAGRLVGPSEAAVSDARIQLLVAAALPPFDEVHPRRARITADGSFEFDQLPPGNYIIGVDLDNGANARSYSPRLTYSSAEAAPQPIAVKAGQRVDLGALRLPEPARRLMVSGVATWEDGRPATAVRVVALDRTEGTASLRLTGDVLSEADGKFTIQLWPGRTYRLRAQYARRELTLVDGSTVKTDVQSRAPIRIVVRRAPR